MIDEAKAKIDDVAERSLPHSWVKCTKSRKALSSCDRALIARSRYDNDGERCLCDDE